jgi:2'-5' RNA ligase
MKILKMKQFLNEAKSFKYELGCVMLKFNIDNWEKEVLSIIDKEDIYDEPGFGLEDECHVTVFFGIKPDESEAKDVSDKIKECDCDIDKEYLLENISIFENEDYDVVKFDVKKCRENEEEDLENCEGLKEMNKFIEETFPNKQDFPDYKPHVTIGYVVKGKGKKYIQKLKKPIIATPSKLVYSYLTDKGNSKRTINIIEY